MNVSFIGGKYIIQIILEGIVDFSQIWPNALVSFLGVITTVISIILFTLQKKRVLSSAARRVFSSLQLAWIFYGFAFFFVFLRVFLYDDSLYHQDLLVFKLAGASLFAGAAFNGVALSFIIYPENPIRQKGVLLLTTIFSLSAMVSWISSPTYMRLK